MKDIKVCEITDSNDMVWTIDYRAKARDGSLGCGLNFHIYVNLPADELAKFEAVGCTNDQNGYWYGSLDDCWKMLIDDGYIVID